MSEQRSTSAAALSIGQCATLATLLEASAPKPGNVHRGADFEDLTFYDFAASAVAIAPSFEAAAAGARVGATVLSAVRATRSLIRTNSNLGTILLLAPLAKVPRGQSLREGVAQVLAGLDATDSRQVYEAIRLAQPGGMGRVAEADLAEPPPADLLAAMRLAADRDRVARQYVENFADLFDVVILALKQSVANHWPLPDGVVWAFLRVLAQLPDSLIARKCGAPVAQQTASLAARVLEAGTPGDEDYHAALADFDFWLRADHHRRNPGTTADLIAAALFALLRDGELPTPFRFA